MVLLLQTGPRVGEEGHAPSGPVAEARKLLSYVKTRMTAMADDVYRNPIADYTCLNQAALELYERRRKMETGLLTKLPSRLHHNAFVVKDHEVNRKFFEDLLGIPLVATWCEKNYSAELQREVEFCHTFFGMADGGALAFFQFADPELYQMTQAEKPAKIGRYDHIAFKAEPQTYEELKRRLEGAGEKFRETNHGYCKSIYVSSPDGLIVEFTQDPDDVAEIDAVRRADAHQELARWLGGDRRTNNDLRGRAI